MTGTTDISIGKVAAPVVAAATGAVGLVAAATVWGAATGSIEERSAEDPCSIEPIYAPQATDVTFFLAVALSDTVEAGPGDVEYWPFDDDRSTPEDGAIYGQRVRVRRFGGADADRLRSTLDPDRTAIVVPWGYRSDCRTIRWQESARWIEPGASTMHRAFLRHSRHWVDGRPTFDVRMAWVMAHPRGALVGFESRRADGSERSSSDRVLTAEQLFEAYRRMPAEAAVEEDAATALRPFCEWARANPELTRRYPARWMLRWARRTLSSSGAGGLPCGPPIPGGLPNDAESVNLRRVRPT